MKATYDKPTMIVSLDWVEKFTTEAEQDKLKDGKIVKTRNGYVTCVQTDTGFCFMVHPEKPESVEAVYRQYFQLGGF